MMGHRSTQMNTDQQRKRNALVRGVFIFPISVSLCLSAAAPARAAPDPELNKPYRLKVVLYVAEDRALTPLFQQRLERELGDLLRLTYGPLARVEVVHVHRLLKDIRTRGLRALDDWSEPSEFKTHFVLVDYADGCYRLRARQYDGMTGMASPVVRRDRTPEPRLVARAAARLVDRDFGLTGTVTKASGGEVEVTLKGGGLGVELGRWIKPGDIFAVARVTAQGNQRLASAVLRVEDAPKDGVCRCRLFHRRARDTLADYAGVGYRCLKLTTAGGPVRLRLVNDRDGSFLSGWLVVVSASGYDPGDAGEKRVTGVDGLIVTKEKYDGVAFLRVYHEGKLRARLPVEIVDDRVTVCRIDPGAGATDGEQLRLRAERWLQRAGESLILVSSRITDLNEALKRSPEAALKVAEQVVKGIDDDLAQLRTERNEILEERNQLLSKKAGSVAVDLREGDRNVEELEKQRGRLEQFAQRQRALIQEAASPERRALEGKLQQARLCEAQADYGEAIRLYEEVVRQSKDTAPKVAEYLRTLKRAWDIPAGREKHRQARDFVYSTWPRLDATGVKNEIKHAVEAFQVCKKYGDRLTVQKLLQANVAHAAGLTKRLDALHRGRDSEDNRAEAKALSRTAQELSRLQVEASAFVRAAKGPG